LVYFFALKFKKICFSNGCIPVIFILGKFKKQGVNSIDPRVNRLLKTRQQQEVTAKAPLDQFGTFEVFVQPKPGKPFQHEGIVHAPEVELAYVLAKEAFTRRFLCTSLCVAATRHIFVSPMSEGTKSAYDLLADSGNVPGKKEWYEIYHLLKRGKQHIHAATVYSADPAEAMNVAKREFAGKIVFNIWAIRTADFRFTAPEEADLWATLPEKKFREASEYKGGDKLKDVLDQFRS
jgi:ring-1,2-phenylacetyl-CoA epoxidase subunit PaaB